MVERLDKIEFDTSGKIDMHVNNLEHGLSWYNRTCDFVNDFARQYEILEKVVGNHNFINNLAKEDREKMRNTIDQLRPIYETYCKVAREQNE